VFAFAMQIFFDFSGYTDMAIGMALLLGFHFPVNFRRPYLAFSITDFWHRWHMSLSRCCAIICTFRWVEIDMALDDVSKSDTDHVAGGLVAWGDWNS